MIVEVRCCCDPGKLLGWVAVDTDDVTVRVGASVNFLVTRPAQWLPTLDSMPSMIEYVTLTFARLTTGQLALKSNDIPIEKLKRITSWRSNTVVEI